MQKSYYLFNKIFNKKDIKLKNLFRTLQKTKYFLVLYYLKYYYELNDIEYFDNNTKKYV